MKAMLADFRPFSRSACRPPISPRLVTTPVRCVGNFQLHRHSELTSVGTSFIDSFVIGADSQNRRTNLDRTLSLGAPMAMPNSIKS